LDLVEDSPGNKVNLANELKGKGVIIGVPAAFSPACSASHIPGFINHPKLKEAGQVFVVAVNDPFVTKAWATSLDPTGKSGVRFLGDPSGEFTKALDLSFESSAIFGNDRSKRYALLVENGKVKEAFVEPDNIGLNGRFVSRYDWKLTNVREFSLRCREGARLKRCIRKPRPIAHSRILRSMIGPLLRSVLESGSKDMTDLQSCPVKTHTYTL
jgi:2-Cys peroxiredoxin 5